MTVDGTASGKRVLACGAAVIALLAGAADAAAQWRPSRPIELVVPAGTGGGADKMARLIQRVVIEHGLLDQPLVVRNGPSDGGAEGLMLIKGGRGDAHRVIITLSNLFTTPLARGVPFSWRDLTPVAMLALDEFVLWVPADAPYATVGDFVGALRRSPDGTFTMAGTGSKQEDQLIVTALESVAERKMTYLPFSGGGAVAAQLADKQVSATVNNPIEGLANWQRGAVRPLCVFDDARMPYSEPVTQSMAWGDIPTCRESGVDVVYLMLRGIFLPADVSQEQIDFYVELFRAIRETPEWREFMHSGAFNQTFMTGGRFAGWLEQAEREHVELMRRAGFIAN